MNISTNPLTFGQKYPTDKILEITSHKIFATDGVVGFVNILRDLHGSIPKYPGHVGYRKYAEEVGEKITSKYPELLKATNDILEIANKNRYYSAKELRANIKPILDRFNKEIDIII